MMVPEGYRMSPSQVNKSITGGWINVTLVPDSSIDTITMVSGELLAVDYNSTFHILTSGGELISLNKSRISTVRLYFFTNPNVSLFGFLGVIPNVIGAVVSWGNAGYFLLMGVPIIATSIATTVADHQDGNSIISYPGNTSLRDYSRYARFPQGLPPGLQREKLHLVFR